MRKLNVSVFTALSLLSAVSFTAAGQDKPDRDDDTLKYYLSKSDAVVVAKVTDGLQRIGVDFNQIPVNAIEFEAQVTDSIKGNVAAKKKIMVSATRAHN